MPVRARVPHTRPVSMPTPAASKERRLALETLRMPIEDAITYIEADKRDR